MATADFIHQYHDIFKELVATKAEMEQLQQKIGKIKERPASSQSGTTNNSGTTSRSGTPHPGTTSRPGTTPPSGTTTEPVEGIKTPTSPSKKAQDEKIQEARAASVTTASTSTTIRRYLVHISGLASI